MQDKFPKKKGAADQIVDAMHKAYVERGAQTESDFIREGFSLEEIAIGKEPVARRIRETESIAA